MEALRSWLSPKKKEEIENDSSAVGGGGHDISLFGSACLMANNVCGSAMVQIPGLFQAVGWVPASVSFVVISAWSTASALFLARLIQRMPGNAAFGQRVEFGRAAQALLPHWAYLSVVLVLCATFICQNISNIIVSAQSVDDALVASVGTSCALAIYPQPAGSGGNPFFCIHADGDQIIADSPFNGYVVSLGYIIIALVTIPLSYLALDSNIIFQILGMILLSVCILIWVVQFCVLGLQPALLPAAGAPTGGAYSSLISTVVFNYGFVTTVPSWLNEKGLAVPTARTLWASVSFATFLYLVLGVFGGLALDFSGGADILSVIVYTLPSLASGPLVTASQIACYVFPIANLVTSIPVFSIIVRYNIVNTGLLPLWGAHAVAVGLPWVLSLFFYAGNQLAQLINWSSALFFVSINLAIPLYLYWAQTARMDKEAEALATGDLQLLDEDSLLASPSTVAAADAAAASSIGKRGVRAYDPFVGWGLEPGSGGGGGTAGSAPLHPSVLYASALTAANGGDSDHATPLLVPRGRGGGEGEGGDSDIYAGGSDSGLAPALVATLAPHDQSAAAAAAIDDGLAATGGGIVHVLPPSLTARFPRLEPRLVVGLVLAAAVLAAASLAVQAASAAVPTGGSGS